MLEWNCGQKDVKKRVTSAPDVVNVNQGFLAWLKEPKLLRSPRERSTEI